MDGGQIVMKYGKYEGKQLKDLPEDYLLWMVKKGALRGRAMLYAKRKINYPMDTYKVIVENAACGDGEYLVQAHSTTDAIRKCQKENKIQNTQSFDGTGYTATKQINL